MERITGHLALVVGHTRKKPGALGVHPINASEYEFNGRLAEQVERFGRTRGHEVRTFFRDHVGIRGAYAEVEEWEPDAVVELHFNAFNGRIRGTETLYCDEQDAKSVRETELARCLQTRMCAVYGRQGREDRGLRNRLPSRGERGYFNVSQVFGFPSVLIEPFFGDNREDARLGAERLQDLAECIVLAFEEWKAGFAAARGYTEDSPHRPASGLPDLPDAPDLPDVPDTPAVPGTGSLPDTP